ncbi:hypothetical protein CMI37_34020 [Candidatus Pacearchaeota archaeon]|nr:hypothetical protein [Candidatus Pacearchaeota archaeon]|tara:strand:- start:568 stop:1659 length:1092 start_codon:yes stop_codon:yes gene_type:complete
MTRVSSSSALSKSYSSYSGVDIRVIINGFHCGNIQYISYMIQREKGPNYIMGSVDPISFARGKRGVNGIIRGLMLDADMLNTEAFDNEVALLDKDELFSTGTPAQVPLPVNTSTPQPRMVPKYRNLPLPIQETRSKYEWIFQTHIKHKMFPGGSLNDAAWDCVEGAVTGALQSVGIAVATGGTGAIPAAANFIRAAIFDCIGAVAESALYDGGFIGLAGDLYNSVTMWSTAYEERLADLEKWKLIYEKKKKEMVPFTGTVLPSTSTLITNTPVNSSSKGYDLTNLGSNYSIVKPEYLDQILPFDIVLVAVNEYGQSAQMRLYGCEITSANSEMNVNGMTLPYSLNFLARNILPWRSFDLQTQA